VKKVGHVEIFCVDGHYKAKSMATGKEISCNEAMLFALKLMSKTAAYNAPIEPLAAMEIAAMEITDAEDAAAKEQPTRNASVCGICGTSGCTPEKMAEKGDCPEFTESTANPFLMM
jgi:hypothetical protein